MNEEKCLLCVYQDSASRCQVARLVYGEDKDYKTGEETRCELFTRCINEGIHTIAITPGGHVADMMLANKLTIKDVDDDIVGVLMGTKAVDDEVAEKLSKQFGMSALFWKRLQKIYEEKLEKVKGEICQNEN